MDKNYEKITLLIIMGLALNKAKYGYFIAIFGEKTLRDILTFGLTINNTRWIRIFFCLLYE